LRKKRNQRVNDQMFIVSTRRHSFKRHRHDVMFVSSFIAYQIDKSFLLKDLYKLHLLIIKKNWQQDKRKRSKQQWKKFIKLVLKISGPKNQSSGKDWRK